MADLTFTAPDFGSNPIQYLKEVRMELKKVQWLTREQMIRYTLIVFAVSVAVGALLGSLDYIFTNLFSLLLTR